MAKKSVSLFEVLPPSQAKAGAKPQAQAPKPETPIARPEPAPFAASKPRQSISIDNDIPAAAEPISKPKPRASKKVQSHSVEGVSVREKSDPFFLILACMLALVVVSSLVAYKFGFQKGLEVGASISLDQKSQESLPQAQQPRVATQTPEPSTGTTHQATLKQTLPTTFQQMSPEQTRAAIPPEELKKYTLQIQTFGRKSLSEAKELVNVLKQKGIVAFYDKNDGAVFTGRFKSVNSSEAMQLRNEIVRFNWKNRDFSESFYRSIPKHLLEP